jgi:hypothetical protein
MDRKYRIEQQRVAGMRSSLKFQRLICAAARRMTAYRALLPYREGQLRVGYHLFAKPPKKGRYRREAVTQIATTIA